MLICSNCNESSNFIVDSEYFLCCSSCGFATKSHELTYCNQSYEENVATSYFNNIRPYYDPMNYFHRKINCLLSKQNIRINYLVLKEIKENVKNINKETVREQLKKMKKPKYYPDVPYIVSILSNKKLEMDFDFKIDLGNLYKLFLNEYFNTKERKNHTKTPPVDYTCRIIIEYIDFYSELNKINLPYDPMKYHKEFPEMKSYKKKDNLKIIESVLNEVNFEYLDYKYKFYKEENE